MERERRVGPWIKRIYLHPEPYILLFIFVLLDILFNLLKGTIFFSRVNLFILLKVVIGDPFPCLIADLMDGEVSGKGN